MSPRLRLERTSALALALAATSSLVSAGPCDIYASGGTPCVAAHATTRALYSNYSGPLYQVKRASDGKTADITPLAAGGVANAAIQDTFCSRTTCLITIIYDQSGRNNHLTQAPPGGFKGPAAGGYDNLASATGAPITLNGHRVYGVFSAPGTGYRNTKPNGIATGDAAEGMYAVLDGTHYNNQCCFDYGNAEISSTDTGAGHMEAIYFGNCKFWGSGSGNGPWIMADLENGLFSGRGAKQNTGDPTINHRFVTAIVKGQPNQWAIRGGDTTAGSLSTFYSGARPNGYHPMKKEGSIILGIGGDNSKSAQGTFYEGVMTTGYPTDATENAVQADIVAARYSTAAPTTTANKALAPGSIVSLRSSSSSSSSAGSQYMYLTHNRTTATLSTSPIPLSARDAKDPTTAAVRKLKQQATTWKVHSGLGHAACLSFESTAKPGNFVRHMMHAEGGGSFALVLQPNDGSKQFAEDATFCAREGGLGEAKHEDGAVVALGSWNQPTRLVRRFGGGVYVAAAAGKDMKDGNGDGVVRGFEFDAAEGFHEDVNWVVEPALV